MTSTGVAGYLNSLPDDAARAALARCCAARRWVDAMIAARPFGGDAELLAAAERCWWELEQADWLDAFARHPRIGERSGDPWAQREQAGVDGAGEKTRAALARGNRDYERRFGYVFLICAAGKSADEMLAALESRVANAPGVELQIAADEQAKITRLRLENLVAS